MVDLGAWYRRKRLCQRTGQDGHDAPEEVPSLADPLAALSNWPFWLGLGLYGGAFLLYAAALARLPLNVAHPVLTSGAVATVALFPF